jgi:hypothetical protein
LAALEAGAIVDEKRYEGNLIYARVRGPASLVNRYVRFHQRPERQEWAERLEARSEGEAKVSGLK